MSVDSIALRLAEIAVAAGGPIVEICRRGLSVSRKADDSPVTEADVAAERLIVERLTAQFPGIPIIAEERVAAGCVPEPGDRFFLVDPLDGTRECVAGRDEFTVNIALVEQGRPVAGAIHAPLMARAWYAGTHSYALDAVAGVALDAARARRVSVRPPPAAGLVALVSRSHRDPETERFLDRLPVAERRALGSSLKFCLIAQGDADLYPRFGPTCEWDTGAGHAILAAAGGVVVAPDGMPLVYGNRQAGFRHCGFIACGDARTAQDVLSADSRIVSRMSS